jgi:hypothetical protein
VQWEDREHRRVRAEEREVHALTDSNSTGYVLVFKTI